jgi:tetratricopeptide (TPR) repeat protein
MMRTLLPTLALLLCACSSLSDDQRKALEANQQNAALYFEAGKFQQVLGLVERGLELDDDDYKLRSLRAATLLRLSGPASGEDHRTLDQALAEFEAVFAQRSQARHDVFLLFYYALAEQKQGFRRESESARVEGQRPAAQRDRAAKAEQAKEAFAHARSLLETLLDRGEIVRLCRFHLLQIAAATGDRDGLLANGEAFLEAVAKDESIAQSRMQQTTVLGYEREQKDLVAQLRGDEFEVRKLLADKLYQEGRFEDALRHLDAVLTKDPTRSDDHYNRGLVLRKLGRLDEARQDMRTFLATTSLPSDNPKVKDAVDALLR